jgi:hypothetical protein
MTHDDELDIALERPAHPEPSRRLAPHQHGDRLESPRSTDLVRCDEVARRRPQEKVAATTVAVYVPPIALRPVLDRKGFDLLHGHRSVRQVVEAPPALVGER